MSDGPAPLALTMGEPAGVGGEIALKAWRGHKNSLPTFFIIDDPERLRRLGESAGIETSLRVIAAPEEAAAAFAEALPVLPLARALAAAVAPGRLDPANGAAVIGAIDQAMALVRAGMAAAMVTNPIHKKCLAEMGFAYPGHTEYLESLCGDGSRAVMMLACPGLRVVPVTVHLALRDAVAGLDTPSIVACARTAAAALHVDFGIAQPRLVVAGLNPHAGEEGTMGREEIDIIAPAVRALAAEGIHAAGPLAPDTLFHAAAREGVDAIICMYHDQALIPLKTLDFFGGVNITLGLPVVRTSPDHGTALALAGSGQANEASLVAALRTAAGIAANHRRGVAE